MREVISISTLKAESAFFKANPFSGPEIKETPLRKWSRLDFCLYLEEDDDEIQQAMTRSLNKARKNYLEDLAQDVQGDIDGMEGGVNGVEISSFNPFGRGYACGRGQLIPSRWLLIGGSRSIVGCGKTTRRIDGPTSKAQGSGAGKLTEFFCLRCFSSNFS